MVNIDDDDDDEPLELGVAWCTPFSDKTTYNFDFTTRIELVSPCSLHFLISGARQQDPFKGRGS